MPNKFIVKDKYIYAKSYGTITIDEVREVISKLEILNRKVKYRR